MAGVLSAGNDQESSLCVLDEGANRRGGVEKVGKAACAAEEFLAVELHVATATFGTVSKGGPVGDECNHG